MSVAPPSRQSAPHSEQQKRPLPGGTSVATHDGYSVRSGLTVAAMQLSTADLRLAEEVKKLAAGGGPAAGGDPPEVGATHS